MSQAFSVGDTVKIAMHDVEARVTQVVPSPRGGLRVLYQCQWVQPDGKVIMTYFNDHALELVKEAGT